MRAHLSRRIPELKVAAWRAGEQCAEALAEYERAD